MVLSVGFVTIFIWLFVSGFGAIFSIFNVLVAREDLIYQIGKTERRRERALIAKVNIVNEILRTIALLLFFLAGLTGVLVLEFDPNPKGALLFIRCVILTVIIILVLKTIIHRWLRLNLKHSRGYEPSVAKALEQEREQKEKNDEPTEVVIVNPDSSPVPVIDKPGEDKEKES